MSISFALIHVLTACPTPIEKARPGSGPTRYILHKNITVIYDVTECLDYRHLPQVNRDSFLLMDTTTKLRPESLFTVVQKV